MKRVTGIGGIFFKAKDPDALRAWYRDHLGVPIEAWGGCAFEWRSESNPTGQGMTLLNIVDTESNYFAPSTSPFMLNFRVENLDDLLRALRAEGCQVDTKVDASEFGKFGWVLDPECNRVELWQPPDGQ